MIEKFISEPKNKVGILFECGYILYLTKNNNNIYKSNNYICNVELKNTTSNDYHIILITNSNVNKILTFDETQKNKELAKEILDLFKDEFSFIDNYSEMWWKNYVRRNEYQYKIFQIYKEYEKITNFIILIDNMKNLIYYSNEKRNTYKFSNKELIQFS